MKFLVLFVFAAVCGFSSANIIKVGEVQKNGYEIKPQIFEGFLNRTVEAIRELVARVDPIKVDDYSRTFLDRFDISLSGLSLKDFSNFAITELEINIRQIAGLLRFPLVPGKLRSFRFNDKKSDVDVKVLDLQIDVRGLTIDFGATYDLFPSVRVNSIKGLPQFEEIDIDVRIIKSDGTEVISGIDAEKFTRRVNDIFKRIHDLLNGPVLLIINAILNLL